VSLVEQELPTLPEYLSSPLVFSGVRVTRSLVLCVCFVDRCLSFCTFSFGHCVVCSSSIYGFWLPLWYLQTLLINKLNTLTRMVAYSNSSPIFSGVRVARSLMCNLCRSLFILLSFVYLAILLSVLLRFTDSDYPFVIFKHFFLQLITAAY
jgi:hypothetical protein